MNERILVVDDEKAIADLVGIYLTKEGFDVQVAYSGADAAKAILEQEFDLALLDVMLPDIDGLELLRTIRSSHTYPVIMLTARDAQQDKIEGLSIGADDYVVKPFRPLELIARVHAQLRRYTSYGSRAQAAESPTIQFDGLEINRDARSVTVDGAPVRLTPIEYSILLYLVEHRGSVVGYLSLLQEAPELPVEQRAHFTGVALDKAHRLDALIEEFFDITRFDFHDIVLTRGYVDLGLLLAQVADEFYPILNEQHKEAQVDIREDLTVLVDGDKMARVFNNIMKNAVAYSYEGSTITIEARRQDDGGVRVRFINQGDPIPAAKLKVIFEKFYRLDAARATNRGGAGLGLAIAKEIVTAHGGSIACESTPEHTMFTIELPAA